MSERTRRSARRRTGRSGVSWYVVLLAIVAVMAGIVFAIVRLSPGTNQAQGTDSARVENSSDDQADTGGKNTDSASTSKKNKEEEDKDKKDETESSEEKAKDESASTDDSSSAQTATTQLGSTQGRTSQTAEGTTQSEGSSTAESPATNEGQSTQANASANKSAEWISGQACASDVAESGTITSSDIPFDDSTPQIGLDLRSNPWAHLGDYVEVRYGDVTVKAQVVDCGAYNGGSSGILINPAVFEQFGSSSVYDWGRRTVEYRFV